MPAVHQVVDLTDTTPVSFDQVQRNGNNCIIGVRHRYGYADITWTFTRDPSDFLVAASALVADS